MTKYRSKLEEKLARYLELNDRQFEYEPTKLPYVIEANYTPDFVLPNGVILEAKGWFKPEDRRKMLAVKAAHPELDIRMVFQNPQNPINKGSNTTYAMWCDKNGFPWAHYMRIPIEWFD
jgi:hypothetical protein